MKNSDEIIKNVQCALKEDIGTGDATSDLIDSHSLAEAKLISRDMRFYAVLIGLMKFLINLIILLKQNGKLMTAIK